ncbi:ATP-dependent DNA helicase [Trichonephila clavata]|uniref:ATP-dependent DNA helicase n=1 Tax=Trichonephila clavata TaxID=2740835 RepID=A0A8X6KZC4_TRICU|nr:ATP-dependent DNA helicase [Trichonephila clavata]
MNASHGKGFSVFQPTNKCPDDKYRELIQKCNLKQWDLVQHLQSCLRREPTIRLHWMIQGAAGTGKSFLIHIIEQTLIRMFEKPDQDPSQPTVLKMAPTGTNMYKKVNSHLKQFKGSEEPFGGLRILHFGDFNQLPTVKDAPIFKQISGLNQLAPPMWHLTQYYELNEIMRQKDDKTYAELLNRLALGELTDKDVELLKTKQTILEKVPKSATLLYHSNHDFDLANKLRLNSIEGPLVKSQAYDSVSETAPNSSKQKVLDKVRNFDRTKTGNLENR